MVILVCLFVLDHFLIVIVIVIVIATQIKLDRERAPDRIFAFSHEGLA